MLHFKILGKELIDEHLESISIIFVTLQLPQFETFGDEDKDELPEACH